MKQRALSPHFVAALSRLDPFQDPERDSSLFEDPVFIVSAPRAGSQLLFEQLAKSRTCWTIGGESHDLFAVHPHLSEALRREGRLTEAEADPSTQRAFRLSMLHLLRNAEGQRYLQLPPSSRPFPVRLLEKTPRNALNIRFLCEVFPTARFVFLYRDPCQNIGSLIDGWVEGARKGRFITYPHLPGWKRGYWCFLLVPGWERLNEKPLAYVAARQWQAANEAIMEDLAQLPRCRWTTVSYAGLVARPEHEIRRLCTFARAVPPPLPEARSNLPLSSTTLTPPYPDKWKRHEPDLTRVLPHVAATLGRLTTFVAE